MSYLFVPVIFALVFAAVGPSINTQIDAMIVFDKGLYDPNLVGQFGGQVKSEAKSLGMVAARIPAFTYPFLAASPSVDFVEPDSDFSTTSVTATESAEYLDSWEVSEIGAEKAYTDGYTGKGIKIALLDTGIDYTHPDLAPNYKGGYDFINSDDDPMDDNGHGTHVAGIIAAANNGIGVVGVAPEADIYAIKVSDSNGKGSFSGLVEGIDWAIENDMNIVTMSITGDGGTRALQQAVETAYNDYGLILVAAVGNGGTGGVLYPAAYPEVIGVGSIAEDGSRSTFSRTGNEVELVAPGAGINSAAIGGKYRISSGTSMATPSVTGSIALVLQSNETMWKSTGVVDGDGVWTNEEVRNVLRTTATDLGVEGRDDEYGYGRVTLDFPSALTIQIPQPTDPVNQTLDEELLWARFLLSLG